MVKCTQPGWYNTQLPQRPKSQLLIYHPSGSCHNIGSYRSPGGRKTGQAANRSPNLDPCSRKQTPWRVFGGEFRPVGVLHWEGRQRYKTCANAWVVVGHTSATTAAGYSIVVLRVSKTRSQTAKTVVNICVVLQVGKCALMECQEGRQTVYTICLLAVPHFGK